jgi:hypothetical protein
MRPPPAEDRPPLGTTDRAGSPEAPRTTARAARGKTKRAAETEDEGTGTGTLCTARGKRTPTTTAAGAASNRLATASKGCAVAALASSAKSSTARTVGGEGEHAGADPREGRGGREIAAAASRR